MTSIALEWLNLIVRWIHVIAAIMWIGDSFLFVWLDSQLQPPRKPREGAVTGELWMVHSGGFYEVVKRRYLRPDELPETLHWFKWEAYSTWISGFLLLGVVYYLGGGVFLIDSRSSLSLGGAIALSLALLAGAWLLYDALWSSPLSRRPALAAGVSFALVVAAAFTLTHLLSGRGAFIHLGAMLGTIMVANVWRRIIPAQTQMLAATKAGQPVDTSLGARAKMRSLHNHYLTLPVLFTMLSNHFPITYGNPLNWLVLVLLVILGAAVKYVMNFRGGSNRWVVLGGVAALVAVVALTMRVPGPASAAGSFRDAPPVSFQTAQAIIERRCITCHAAHPSNPSFPQPPNGVILEDPERIRSLAPRIMVRAVVTRTMPLGNLTGMTEEERALLGAWVAQGARLDGGPGPASRRPSR